MRDTFIEALIQQMEVDDSIILLTADLGFGVLDAIESKFPDRLLNVGISEQNMISVAAGMALEGLTIVAYSIGNFPTLRCLEQLRNDVGYHQANVKVVSVGAGFSYGPLGMSHHAVEDIAIMRALPGFDVVVPSSHLEVTACTNEILRAEGPAYLRLDKSVMLEGSSFQMGVERGKLRKILAGDDISIIGVGGVMSEAAKATEILLEAGISSAMYTVPFIEPLSLDEFLKEGCASRPIFTIEEHTITGGLGSKLIELLTDQGIQIRGVRRLGLPRKYVSLVGSQQYLRRHFGLDAYSIADLIAQTLRTSADPI